MTRKAAEAEGKLPWLPLVVADYLRDTQHLSLETQGAWMRILCWMHTSQTRGRVVFDKRKLARSLGTTDDRAVVILGELRDAANPTGSATCEYDDLGDGSFALTSRRMVRDEHIRQVNRANGLKGGNRALFRENGSRLSDSVKRPANPPVKPPLNPRVKSQRENTGEVSPDPSSGDASRTPAPAQAPPVKPFVETARDPVPDITIAPSKTVKPPANRALSDEHNAIRESFIDWWTLEAWPRHVGDGAEYPFSAEGKRNGAAAMKLLTAMKWDLEQAKAVAMAYLLADDAFIARQGRPLFGLTNQITTWITAARSPRPFRANGAKYDRRKPTAAERGEHEQPDRELPSLNAGPLGPGDRAKAG